jgi:hypothetical protein
MMDFTVSLNQKIQFRSVKLKPLSLPLKHDRLFELTGGCCRNIAFCVKVHHVSPWDISNRLEPNITQKT